MAYDDVILSMGEFGRYQRRIYLLLCLPAIPNAFHTMAGVFLAAQTDFRCLLPHESPENATYQLPPNIGNASYPLNYEDWSKCEGYDVNLTDQFYESDNNFSFTTQVSKCESFVYDKSTYQLTAATEFNLVCGNAWLIVVADSLFMAGVMLGSMIFGGLSDRYGRRPILYYALLLQAISGLLVAASPEIISYMIFRFIVGGTVSGVYPIAYVSALEMVVPKRRLMTSIGLEIVYSLGYVLTTAFAYFITNWRILQIAFTIPNIAFLTYWWFIPESARWLVNMGRLDEAKDLLQKAALENGVELSGDRLDSLLKSEYTGLDPKLQKSSIYDLLRYPNLRRKTLLLLFIWFVNVFTYFGLAWNTSSLVGNDYINFAIAGLVEIPAHLFVFFTMDKWGRKNILCSCLLLAGASLLLTIFVPGDIERLKTFFAMVAKLAITASYAAVLIFTAEQYPTTVRNVGIGACATSGRLGGVLAPYINYFSTIWSPLAVIIFGSTSVIAGLLTLLLPETLNQKLPESIQDGEQFGKRSKELNKTSTN